MPRYCYRGKHNMVASFNGITISKLNQHLYVLKSNLEGDSILVELKNLNYNLYIFCIPVVCKKCV